MPYKRFVHEYQKTAVQNASPVGLIVMLYDGAINFMERGKHAMGQADYDKQNQYLQKAQRIVMELIACLDMDQGGEIAQNLFSLYTFALNQLVEANLMAKPEGVDRALRVFTEIRESWVAIEEQLKQGEMLNAA